MLFHKELFILELPVIILLLSTVAHYIQSLKLFPVFLLLSVILRKLVWERVSEGGLHG